MKTDGSFGHVLIGAVTKYFFCFDASCWVQMGRAGFGPSNDLNEYQVKLGRILLLFNKF